MPSFRMHLRAHGMVAMVFKTLDDSQHHQVFLSFWDQETLFKNSSLFGYWKISLLDIHIYKYFLIMGWVLFAKYIGLYNRSFCLMNHLRLFFQDIFSLIKTSSSLIIANTPYHTGYLILVIDMICKYFLWLGRFSFIFLIIVFFELNSFKFWWSPMYLFFLWLLCFLRQI